MDQRLTKTELIGKAKELQRLFLAQNRLAGESVVIKYAETDRRRVTFITRGIKKAVERNRVKRQLREIYRTHKRCFPYCYDYLFVAQPKTLKKDFNALKTEVLDLVQGLTHA